MTGEARRLGLNYAIAGLLFALLMSLCGFLAFSQTQINTLRAAIHPLQWLYLFWIFVWPVVLTVNIVTIHSRPRQWLMISVYLSVLFVLGIFTSLSITEMTHQFGDTWLPSWSGETPIRLLGKWALFNLAPTLLLIAFRFRQVRAIAPLLMSFMLAIAAGILGIIYASFHYLETSVAIVTWMSEILNLEAKPALILYFLLIILAACLIFGLLGWWCIGWLRSAYLDKTVSDQSLAIDALWLIFASFYAVMLAFAGPGWALSALVAYVLYKTSVNLGNNWYRARERDQFYEPTLLVLRVFSLGKRSEILFERITKLWRHLGNVQLIAGADLARTTIAPHQFLSFLSGKLNQLFVRNDGPFEDYELALDTCRDHDGRFRINDYFCHADSWRIVLSRLVKHADAILMDLRNYSKNNSGCDFEIEELLNTVPLQRLVFVIDTTTNRALLNDRLKKTCRELRATSPNRGISASSIRPFELKDSAYDELQRLLLILVTAASEANTPLCSSTAT